MTILCALALFKISVAILQLVSLKKELKSEFLEMHGFILRKQ